MGRDYDLFEQFADGSVVWKCRISGREAPITKLAKLAAQTEHEVFAMHLRTQTVISRMKSPPARLRFSREWLAASPFFLMFTFEHMAAVQCCSSGRLGSSSLRLAAECR